MNNNSSNISCVKVPVINKSNNPLPTYANPGDAGVDLRADMWEIHEKFLYNAEVVRESQTTTDDEGNTFKTSVIKGILIHPGGRALIPTELYTAIPEGYEVQVRPRSGLALKSGITVLNSPGTIDSGYRNGWGVILMNEGSENFLVQQGDRIAQAVLVKYEHIDWVETENLEDSERGLTGFGDSGVK